MKRAFIYFIIASAAFASCKKDKNVFSESPDERINRVLTAYQDTLTNAPYGWKGFIFPSGLSGGVVSFYFKFNKSNRVEMFSDFDSLSAVTVMESSYRLKALQQPALIFDTYCYVTVLTDPDASVNGGNYGSGLSSDFEFAIDSVKGDSVKLTGRLHNSKAYLLRASKQEMDDFYNKKHTNRLIDSINRYLTYFKRVTVAGVTYEVLVNTDNRTATITWIDSNGAPHTITTGYYYTATGVGFTTPVVNGSTTISSFDNIAWNSSTLVMTVTVNGTTQAVASAARPLSPDATAPTRWRQYAINNSDEWKSLKGFHINGVDDALGITTIANFYYLSYYPAFGVSGSTPYDITGFYKVINNQLTLNYAPAFRAPTTFTDGRTTFTYLGYLGTIPTADSIPVARTRNQLTNATGYYFVQKDPTTYDMVGAADGKAWIRWQF